jgi:hypothetical protein
VEQLMIERIRALITRQPIATIGAAITGLVVAGIALVNAFQPGTVTEAQQGEVVKFLAAMWVVLGLVWPTVTPSRAPKLPEGTPVLLPDGTAGEVTRT